MDVKRRQRLGGPTQGKPQRFSRRPGGEASRGRRPGQKGFGREETEFPSGRKRRRAEDEDIDSDSVSGAESAPPSDSESDKGEFFELWRVHLTVVASIVL